MILSRWKRTRIGAATQYVLARLGVPDRIDRYLVNAHTLLHVGANDGGERDLYAENDLEVLWIEPIPEVFARLDLNISRYPRQKAVQALITENDREECVLNVASNSGASSSLLDLGLHERVWPSVEMSSQLKLTSRSLDALLADRFPDRVFDALVIDTQGTELSILRGSPCLLEQLRFIKVEVPDFESYTGCALLPEMIAFMEGHGFSERDRLCFKFSKHGAYYDILFEK